MLTVLIPILFAIAFGGLAWYFTDGVKIKAGWQNGDSPLARWLDARRRERFNRQLPDALGTMSNALRAGFSLSQAFDSVVEQGEKPMSEEFAIVQQQRHLGMSFEDALASLAARVGSDDLTLVTTAILVSHKTGGNITEIFDKISGTIRGRMRIQRKIRTLTSQGRLQGIVVSSMPVFLGLAMTILKPQLMIPFFCSFFGFVCILASVALIALGWIFIRRIINIDI